MIVAPALVATIVPAGTHRIVFRYRGWRYYPLLLALGAGVLLTVAYTDIRQARSHTSPADDDPNEDGATR